jgi:hypothetical protein
MLSGFLSGGNIALYRGAYIMTQPEIAAPREVVLVASGDLRHSANQVCWAAQKDMEQRVSDALAQEGWTVRRAHAYDPALKHGFIWNQRMGMDVFQSIHPDSPLIVAEAVWQYSHHVLAGLRDHRGPILTLANWSGQWPGLVGMLNLNGSLTKMGVHYSTLWSVDFTDDFFVNSMRQWLREGKISHDTSHAQAWDGSGHAESLALGRRLAAELKRGKAIIGVFDEGCMGMYNAIIDDEMLNPTGIYKERLSQSALVAAMGNVTDQDAQLCRRWLESRGMRFLTGRKEATELTDHQIMLQLKMYVAAVRIAHDYHCDAIGIQYQQGLKDSVPASDLVEGLLNNVERPPVYGERSGLELYPGQALPHFNEVDEGAAVDALVTNRIWTEMGLDPATTLHDIRWGEHYAGGDVDDFVWVFLISGAAPASHFVDGYAGATSERQSPMYFRLGGGTLKGISKPGEIVWSRVFVMDGRLHADLGRATVVALPAAETERRWLATSPQWPIMHAVLHGVTRDQMMARHKANHLNVAYAPTVKSADQAMTAKAAMFADMGIEVHMCGVSL